MENYRAQVKDNLNFEADGTFLVECSEISDNFFYVQYVSPYFASHKGGFIGIPEVGSIVLITKAENSDKWYYLGTIVSPETTLADPDVKFTYQHKGYDGFIDEEGIYEKRGVPQKVILRSPLGQKLVLSDDYEQDNNNIKIELKTMTGKKFMIAESPDLDGLHIKNEFSDGIIITSDKNNHHPTRSVISSSRGSQNFTSREGGIRISIVDGQDITIENTSTGLNALPTNRDKTGNINLTSKYNDINIWAGSKDGRVFIDAGNHLQLECTEGTLTLYAKDDLFIQSEGSINVKAGESLKMEGNDVHIKGQTVNVEGQASLNLHGKTTNVGGQSVSDPVQLAPLTGVPTATSSDEAFIDKTNYGK